MTEQHTATMRFVRGASASAPLADPLTEEEAVLVSDTQAAIQRLRRRLSGDLDVLVDASDLTIVLDALDAATVRVRALEYAATWVNETFDDDNDTARSYEQRTSLDHLRITLSGQDYMNATPRAADPDAA